MGESRRVKTLKTTAPQLLEKIFSSALDQKDPALQESYLAEACGDNALLRQEIDQLLAAHQASGNFLTDIERTQSVDTAGHWNSVQPTENSNASLEAPPNIPGFTIKSLLGRGGLGAVYQAYDQKLQRQVAIKVLAHGDNQELRGRILAEARKAASLSDPAIVTIYSVHEQEDPPAISMELVEGFPVDRATRSLTIEQRARILQQVARALAVAHRAGVIHRDLKPENVMVTPELQPKILDFGLAVSLEEVALRRNFFEGTPRYASPEQVSGSAITPASDIFSFGSLMFKVLTGRAPFDGESTLEILDAIRTSEPPFLKDMALGVPEDLQAICLACLARNPEERPQATEIVVDLGRFLSGEPVRLRPALYGDILRRKIAEQSNDLLNWDRQGMISHQEKDQIEVVHRGILADEDHWIVDARRISVAQTILYTGSWLIVISSALTVWLVRDQLNPLWRWLAPLCGALWLLGGGFLSFRRREPLASASFLAGAVLSVVPTVLALLKEGGLFSGRPESIKQLLPDFSNSQILAASFASLGLSIVAWVRLRMTGFAWTTGILLTLSYWTVLLCANWLEQKPDVMALWLLPLIALEPIGLLCESKGRVRWSFPFHLIAFVTLIGALDVIALEGPTLALFGIGEGRLPYFNHDRQRFLSLALNGYLFLVLMLFTERARSLDLRRASRILEPLALLHMLGPLYANAHISRGKPGVLADVTLYVGTVALLLLIGPWRSRWRILVGALGGVALGSYLLIDLDLVRKTVFTFVLAAIGLLSSGGTFLYLLRLRGETAGKKPRNPKRNPPL